jgi:hypothetical protein
MKNRYASNCNTCRQPVPAGAGTLHRINRNRRTFWAVSCGCRETPEQSALRISAGNRTSYGVVTSTGWTGYRNRAGRCEDAPCCGCCTF